MLKNANCLVTLGNQLFDPKLLAALPVDQKISHVFMREDTELCTYEKFHKLKIILFLSAMRSYADELRDAGFSVDYQKLETNEQLSYENALEMWLVENEFKRVFIYEIEDKFFEQRLLQLFAKLALEVEILRSPMFLTSREQFADYLSRSKSKPFMKTFYERQRTRLNILIEKNGDPTAGKWSFDDQNRKPLPKTVEPPKLRARKPTQHTLDVRELCEKRFGKHPGRSDNLWFSTTRADAEVMLERFLDERFAYFGAYEDALTDRSVFVFHSALTPYLNTGLLTPEYVVERALEIARKRKLNIASVEGFIRQVIGWREFVRGIYRNFSEKEDSTNFWNHQRKLSDAWYEGNTGIPPLDDVIKKCNDFAYAHHIERLMVVGNLMLLLEVHPHEAHRWFMEMFIDSSNWVMGPNVYGMGIFSDGGVFATKPYVCGSNYYRKMGGYKKADWCDGVDGLYWGFIEKHKDFFTKNPRLSMMARTVEKMDDERKANIYKAAEELKSRLTKT